MILHSLLQDIQHTQCFSHADSYEQPLQITQPRLTAGLSSLGFTVAGGAGYLNMPGHAAYPIYEICKHHYCLVMRAQ